MRRFNPEKELRKIQKGNKNKIIFGIVALLVIISIGSSYALYQVRYNKRIIYTRVTMNRKDIELAVKVDGQEGIIDHFPTKEEGLIYSGIECDNQDITTATWNYGTWSLDLNSEGPNKCVVTFKEGTPPSLSDLCASNTPLNECIDKHGLEVADMAEDTSMQHNLRYIGANPNNYVWYNCEDYTNLTQETAATKCEKWQIIGLMTVNEGLSGNYLMVKDVKIIRADNVGNKSWNYPYAINNWPVATLNTGFLNNTSTSGYLNASYKDTTNNVKGITAASNTMIEQVIWNLGGPTNYNNATTLQYYEVERSNVIPSRNAAIYNGLIGLMYPSDYGYATSGGSTYNRQQCLDIILYNWSSDNNPTAYSDCAENSWIWDSNEFQWTLTPYTCGTDACDTAAIYVSKFGHTEIRYTRGDEPVVHPSLYLKSSVKIMSGDGSEGTPYIIVP